MRKYLVDRCVRRYPYRMAKRSPVPRARHRRPIIRVVPTEALMIVASLERLVEQVQALAKPATRRRLPPRRVRKRAG